MLDLSAAAVSAPIEQQAAPEEELAIGNKYRHYKGQEYEIVHFAAHAETKEKLVIYRSLSDPEEILARPFAEFKETIWADGREVKRFTRI